jgi:hypothetical protein
MAGTIAVVAPLLLILTVPGYLTDHQHNPGLLVVVAWVAAVCMIVTIPLALINPGTRGFVWLWVSVAFFVALLILEPFTLQRSLVAGSTPWLLALSYVATGCTAVAERNPIWAGLICVGIDVALTVVYARQMSVSHSAISAAGLAMASALFIITIRLRRFQADRVDTEDRRARRLYENQRREAALETERIRTDALLHDSVLATLLAAAGHQAPSSTLVMAETALTTLTTTTHSPRAETVLFGDVFRAVGPQISSLGKDVPVNLGEVQNVEIFSDVADALVAATLQAVSNSAKHAGAAARCTVTAVPTRTGGVRITISDNGCGFQLDTVPAERLGVRVSIMEQVEQVGAIADIVSSPGKGTTVSLEWVPAGSPAVHPRERLGVRMTLIPRRHLLKLLGGLVIVAVLTAVSEAALVTRAVGPVIAAAVGLAILPVLLRGARDGAMQTRTAWSMTATGIFLCCTATIGLDPRTADAGSIYWYTCGILAGAVMLWMSGHHAAPLVAVAFLAAQLTVWAGPTATIRLGLAAEIVLIVAGVMMYRAISRVTTAADVAAATHRELTLRQAEFDAFHLERQHRLDHASTIAAPMLRRILDGNGRLNVADRDECRVLEQALRDEIRGRHLMNDAMRHVVSTHRRRGAHVLVLDDGGLETLDPGELDLLLSDTARHLEQVQASRIIIRTGQPDSDTAITIVATDPDETAAALGLDVSDDDIELWLNIPRPVVALAA